MQLQKPFYDSYLTELGANCALPVFIRRGMQKTHDRDAPVALAPSNPFAYLPSCQTQTRVLTDRFFEETNMSALETTRANSSFSALNLVSNLVASIASWNDARVTRTALAKLSDRELDDIGLCRGDIEFIASRA